MRTLRSREGTLKQALHQSSIAHTAMLAWLRPRGVAAASRLPRLASRLVAPLNDLASTGLVLRALSTERMQPHLEITERCAEVRRATSRA